MKYLLGLLCGLQISDGVFTDIMVRNNLVSEGNPLMQPLIMGGSFLAIKITGAIICFWILRKLYGRFPRLALTVTSSIVVFYGAVMLWNFSVFFTG